MLLESHMGTWTHAVYVLTSTYALMGVWTKGASTNTMYTMW